MHTYHAHVHCIVHCTCAEQSHAHVHCVVHNHMCWKILCTCAVHMWIWTSNGHLFLHMFIHTNDSYMYRKSYTHCTHILDLITGKLWKRLLILYLVRMIIHLLDLPFMSLHICWTKAVVSTYFCRYNVNLLDICRCNVHLQNICCDYVHLVDNCRCDDVQYICWTFTVVTTCNVVHRPDICRCLCTMYICWTLVVVTYIRWIFAVVTYICWTREGEGWGEERLTVPTHLLNKCAWVCFSRKLMWVYL